jgi:hypothetical protein
MPKVDYNDNLEVIINAAKEVKKHYLLLMEENVTTCEEEFVLRTFDFGSNYIDI